MRCFFLAKRQIRKQSADPFAAKAAPTFLSRIVGAALRTGRTYVAKHMDVRERRAANGGVSGQKNADLKSDRLSIFPDSR